MRATSGHQSVKYIRPRNEAAAQNKAALIRDFLFFLSFFFVRYISSGGLQLTPTAVMAEAGGHFGRPKFGHLEKVCGGRHLSISPNKPTC
jgi:hypothetical protein